MANWVRTSTGASVSGAGAHSNSEWTALHNQVDNLFEAQDLFIVDGFIHVQTDTDDLCGVRLMVLPEEMVTGDFTETVPEENSPLIKYSWWCSRGPLPYRIRSKILVPPQHKVWFTIWKEVGSTLTQVNVGARVLVVAKG